MKNLLDDIGNAEAISGIVRNSKWLDRKMLNKILSELKKKYAPEVD